MQRASRPLLVSPFVVLLLVIALGCDDGAFVGSEPGARADAALIVDAEPKGGSNAELSAGTITTVASFDAFAGELPEGIAVDRYGNIYVGMSGLGEIRKLAPDGSSEEVVETFALNAGDLGVLGLRFDPRGDLYAAVSSTNPGVHGVWKISPDGVDERLTGTDAIAFPNDVAVSPRGTVYITDSATGAVWRYTPGGITEMWVQDETLEGTGAFGIGVPIGANGIVVTRGQKMPFARGAGSPSLEGVVVANSEKSQVVYVPILLDGSAGEPTVVITDPDLFGLDGITLDARGTIYGAVNAANEIVRIDRDGSEFATVASGGPLDFPSTLTFGAGSDQHTLFIANFAIIHLLSNPPTPGEANPAVLSLRVGPPGRAH